MFLRGKGPRWATDECFPFLTRMRQRCSGAFFCADLHEPGTVEKVVKGFSLSDLIFRRSRRKTNGAGRKGLCAIFIAGIEVQRHKRRTKPALSGSRRECPSYTVSAPRGAGPLWRGRRCGPGTGRRGIPGLRLRGRLVFPASVRGGSGL